MILILLALGLLLAFILSAGQARTSVVLCTSFSCSFNRGGCCVRHKIIVYDNTVIGLCLYHTDTMSKRILEPMGRVAERGKPNSKMITKIMHAQEDKRDSELIKNPEAFARWILGKLNDKSH